MPEPAMLCEQKLIESFFRDSSFFVLIFRFRLVKKDSFADAETKATDDANN
jgi:hypothetical protein